MQVVDRAVTHTMHQKYTIISTFEDQKINIFWRCENRPEVHDLIANYGHAYVSKAKLVPEGTHTNQQQLHSIITNNSYTV